MSIETKIAADTYSINIRYASQYRHNIIAHVGLIHKRFASASKNNILNAVKCVGFSDKILVELPLIKPDRIKKYQSTETTLIPLITTLNKLYLPFPTQIHKSRYKDWNEDLVETKSSQYVLLDGVHVTHFTVADKIQLKSAYGPEGAQN